MEFKNLKIDLTSILCKIKVCEIENFEKFVELNMQEKVTRIPKVIYNHQIQLHFVKKWAMMRSDIRGGAFFVYWSFDSYRLYPYSLCSV